MDAKRKRHFHQIISMFTLVENAVKNTVVIVDPEVGLFVLDVAQKIIQITIKSILSNFPNRSFSKDIRIFMGYIYNNNIGGSCVGFIDSDGNVFDGFIFGSKIGNIDKQGNVYEVGFFGRGSLVGHVTASGDVYSGIFGGNYLGHVDYSGNIYDNSGLFGGSIIGKADSPKQKEGGAAYLLLIKK